jgi:hypothetical protein
MATPSARDGSGIGGGPTAEGRPYAASPWQSITRSSHDRPVRRSRLSASILVVLLILTMLTAGGRRDQCSVPYTTATDALTCDGSYADATKIGPASSSPETWVIQVPSKDPDAIAGALVTLWRQRSPIAQLVSIFARGQGSTAAGYDRGVLLARGETLTFAICMTWQTFQNIGEVCKDQLHFTVRVPPVAPTLTPTPTSAQPSAAASAAPGEAILVGAGDIASCTNLRGSAATAALIDRIGGTVFAAGDAAYPSGSLEQFQTCYDPTWGQFRARTKPAVGNHEYETPGAAGYFAYFGAAAGDPSKGYYAFTLNGWRVYVVNSTCSEVGGCQRGSQQERWLRSDMAAHPAACSLAIWHHPRFSSGPTGSDREMQDMWADLYAGGAEMLIVGHDHNYQRFAPLDAAGRVDSKRGIREFVVGTGGGSHEPIGKVAPGTEVHNQDTFGVLKLTLKARSFTWQFVPEQGKTFSDRGQGTCH